MRGGAGPTQTWHPETTECSAFFTLQQELKGWGLELGEIPLP